MTQEEKQILLKDLCGRLPYRLLVQDEDAGVCLLQTYMVNDLMFENPSLSIKPYLRPMSSMTDEEKEEYKNLFEYEEREYNQGCCFFDEYKIDIYDEYRLSTVIDWLLKHHFDFRGLISKGLALEAPENMYKEN